MTLAVVEKSPTGEKVYRSAGKADLLKYHPQCGSCGKKKGIHGKSDEVFCLSFNRPMNTVGYCSEHTELNHDR
jgi:hypothetical protein